MSHPFITRCPHCGESVKIPYADVSRFIRRDQALIGVSRRKDLKEHVHKMSHKRWENRPTMHPKEQAILQLSKQEDLATLTLAQIAEKVGITGPWRMQYAWKHLKQLRQKGLLPPKQ